MALNLEDLRPTEAELTLSEKPGKTYTLKKISLAAQIWISNRFGKDKVQTIFEQQSMGDISEIAYYLLKEKTDFPTLLDFQESIVTQQDRANILTAIMANVGLSQPMIDELMRDTKSPKDLSPVQPTGASSTT